MMFMFVFMNALYKMMVNKKNHKKFSIPYGLWEINFQTYPRLLAIPRMLEIYTGML